MESFWHSWIKLGGKASERPVELYLVSNWSWAYQDVLGQLVSGRDDTINSGELLAPSASQRIRQMRQNWQSVLQANDEDFRAFLNCLRFRLGYGRAVIEEQVIDRMQWLGFKTDTNTLEIVTGLVSGWIMSHEHVIDIERLNRTLQERSVRAERAGAPLRNPHRYYSEDSARASSISYF